MNRRDFFKKTSVVGGGVAAIATTNLMASTKDVGATRKDSFSYVDYESLLRPNLLKSIGTYDIGITFSTEDIKIIKNIFNEILNVCSEMFWSQLPCRDFHVDPNDKITYDSTGFYNVNSFIRSGILNYNLNLLSYTIRCELMLLNHQYVSPRSMKYIKKRFYSCGMDPNIVAGDNGLFCNIHGGTIVLNSWFATQ